MDLLSLKECLNELNYPHIKILTDEEVADIFKANNRIFFTQWILNQIETYDYPTDQTKLVAFIAETLHELGFCTSSQKIKFVQGDTSLDIKTQLIIIYRMLNYLKDFNVDQPVQTIIPSKTFDELNSFIKMDLNLFPTAGAMKVFSDSQRQAKMLACNDEIEALEFEINDLKIKLDGVDEETISTNFKNDVNELKMQMEKFEDVSSLFSVENEKFEFNENFLEILARCSEDTKVLAQYVSDMKYISSFKEKVSEIYSIKPIEDDESKIIEEIYEISKNIVNMVRN